MSQDFGNLEETPKHVFWMKGKGTDGWVDGRMEALRHLHVWDEKRMKKRMRVSVPFSEGNWKEGLTTALVATRERLQRTEKQPCILRSLTELTQETREGKTFLSSEPPSQSTQVTSRSGRYPPSIFFLSLITSAHLSRICLRSPHRGDVTPNSDAFVLSTASSLGPRTVPGTSADSQFSCYINKCLHTTCVKSICSFQSHSGTR